MSVNAEHPQYAANIQDWSKVRNVVNSKAKQYILDIDPNDTARNKRYKEDARLTNFTSRTKSGLIGMIFMKSPQTVLPTQIEYIKNDATGNKLTLEKLAQKTTGEVLQAGRYGLLVDYPRQDINLTVADIESLQLKARIYQYTAESIINWQVTMINGQSVLSLVVLSEYVDSLAEDGFTWEQSVRYRVLRLIDGIYTQTVYNDDDEIIEETYSPVDFNGQVWNYIPFVFVGSEDNDVDIDISPLYDLTELNIGHLRNSADYEESVRITGQPTLILSTDMSAEQFAAANPNGVKIGARQGHNLGVGGSAAFLQAAPNQLADVAMKRKEEQAVAIGARLITPVSSNETAEAARIKHGGDISVLSIIANNVEAAIIQCLSWVSKFMQKNTDENEIEFKLNDDFFHTTINPQLLVSEMQLLDRGIIAPKDIRDILRKSDVIDADRTDEDIDGDLGNINPLG